MSQTQTTQPTQLSQPTQTDLIKDKFSTSTHIYLAIASTCLAWLLVVKPGITLLDTKGYTKYLPIAIVYIGLCIILPIIYISQGLYNETDEGTFIISKIAAISVVAIIRAAYLIYYNETNNKDFRWFTWIIMFLFAVNIFEAVVVQYTQRDKFIGGPVDVPYIDVVNSVAGLGLILVLIVMTVKGHLFGIEKSSTKLRLVSNLGPLFILAYTFWNLLFVIQMGDVSTLLFFCVTLLLPIIVECVGSADWLQTRGITLIFFMFLTLGLGYNQANILPMYNNNDDYGLVNIDDKLVEGNIIQQAQQNYYVRLGLMVLTCIFTFLALYKAIMK